MRFLGYKVMRSLVFAVVALLLAASCTSKPATSEEHEEEQHADDIVLTDRQIKAVGISFGKIEEKNLSDVVRVNGSTALNPQDKAEVSPLVGGSLRSISVIEGSKVAKGQTVAWIENTDIVALQREYLQAQSQLTRTKSELARQWELKTSGAGIEKNLQQAESEYQIAHSSAVGLGCQLRQLGISEASVKRGAMVTRIPIKSPISGFVDKIYKSTGSYADAQQPVMTIVDGSKIHIDINIFEKNIDGLKVGQKVNFVLTNNASVRLKGEIYEFASTFTDKTKSLIAHVKIIDKTNAAKLIPGMYVTGTIERGRRPLLAVPSGAIASSEGKSYIFLLEKKDSTNYHFRRIEVVTGAEELGCVQITPTTDIPANSTIVTSGAFYISSILGEEAEHDH